MQSSSLANKSLGAWIALGIFVVPLFFLAVNYLEIWLQAPSEFENRLKAQRNIAESMQGGIGIGDYEYRQRHHDYRLTMLNFYAVGAIAVSLCGLIASRRYGWFAGLPAAIRSTAGYMTKASYGSAAAWCFLGIAIMSAARGWNANLYSDIEAAKARDAEFQKALGHSVVHREGSLQAPYPNGSVVETTWITTEQFHDEQQRAEENYRQLKPWTMRLAGVGGVPILIGLLLVALAKRKAIKSKSTDY